MIDEVSIDIVSTGFVLLNISEDHSGVVKRKNILVPETIFKWQRIQTHTLNQTYSLLYFLASVPLFCCINAHSCCCRDSNSSQKPVFPPPKLLGPLSFWSSATLTYFTSIYPGGIVGNPQVGHCPGGLHHRVLLVVVNQLRQAVKLITTANVIFISCTSINIQHKNKFILAIKCWPNHDMGHFVLWPHRQNIVPWVSLGFSECTTKLGAVPDEIPSPKTIHFWLFLTKLFQLLCLK